MPFSGGILFFQGITLWFFVVLKLTTFYKGGGGHITNVSEVADV